MSAAIPRQADGERAGRVIALQPFLDGAQNVAAWRYDAPEPRRGARGPAGNPGLELSDLFSGGDSPIETTIAPLRFAALQGHFTEQAVQWRRSTGLPLAKIRRRPVHGST